MDFSRSSLLMNQELRVLPMEVGGSSSTGTLACVVFVKCAQASVPVLPKLHGKSRPLLFQQLGDGFQFPLSFGCGLRICQLEITERIDDNSGNNQSCVFLIIGGNDVPTRSYRPPANARPPVRCHRVEDG